MQTSHGGPNRPSGWRALPCRDRKGGPHDGTPRGTQSRKQGEEGLGGGRRTPARGEGPPLGRAQGGVAPQPPERGGRREGPAGAGAPLVSTPVVTRGRPAAGSVCRARG